MAVADTIIPDSSGALKEVISSLVEETLAQDRFKVIEGSQSGHCWVVTNPTAGLP